MMFTDSIINNFVGAGDLALAKNWERDTRDFDIWERDTRDWCKKKEDIQHICHMRSRKKNY